MSDSHNLLAGGQVRSDFAAPNINVSFQTTSSSSGSNSMHVTTSQNGYSPHNAGVSIHTSVSPYDNSSPYSNHTPSPYDNSHPVKDASPPSYANYTTGTYRSNDPTLPENWESYRDPNTNNLYYCNMITMQTTWAHPVTGAVSDSSVPEYAVPDFYSHQAQAQAELEKQTFSPTRPNFDPQGSSMPFDANSQYSPYYYDNQIRKTIDPNVLNQAQLDSIPPRHLDSAKYSQDLSCSQRVCGTMGKNKTLTIVTFLLWTAMAVGGALVATQTAQIEAFIPTFIMYGLYMSLFILPAGFLPFMWFCGVGCSPCLGDKMVESLHAKSTPGTQALLQSINQMARAPPSLTLNVHCYHNKVVHYTERERQQDGSYKTVHKTRTEQVTTFRGYRRVPIIRWKDLSPPSVVVADVVEQCPANAISVNYNYVYDLHPAQKNLIELLRSQYYYTHCFRDDHCNVTLAYDVGVERKAVDVVVKEKNCSYWCSQVFFFNPLSFFLWSYATLMLPIAMVFRTFVRPIPFSSVKYVHIDNPDPRQDVVTFNSPRWVLRWSWY